MRSCDPHARSADAMLDMLALALATCLAGGEGACYIEAGLVVGCEELHADGGGDDGLIKPWISCVLAHLALQETWENFAYTIYRELCFFHRKKSMMTVPFSSDNELAKKRDGLMGVHQVEKRFFPQFSIQVGTFQLLGQKPMGIEVAGTLFQGEVI